MAGVKTAILCIAMKIKTARLPLNSVRNAIRKLEHPPKGEAGHLSQQRGRVFEFHVTLGKRSTFPTHKMRRLTPANFGSPRGLASSYISSSSASDHRLSPLSIFIPPRPSAATYFFCTIVLPVE